MQKMLDFFINATCISDESNLFVNESEKYARFFWQTGSIHLGIFCQMEHTA